MSDLPSRLEAILGSFEEKVSKLNEAQGSLQETTGYARSRDGAVEVRVAPSGAVIDLKLGPRAQGYSPQSLQYLIMEALQTATHDAAQQMQDTLGPILGDQMDQFTEGVKGSSIKPWQPETGKDDLR
ncbi:YbaB/EbfC family nucleoid-associated protein [Glycomyces buryatensis]|uniref:YbaB/EbfC family nucleoid-associated protein n=1 Tax=Glycomyces buryatensis TaxID=2570927 RepID=A0A4S8QIG3_9ACTN|nr:YbaB/EbfC family nucleoid-associated protein [Glycomyces buryatensis]THV40514.1 YbaB/EbfC family nucleoid-associated protein [Glycomyces buryatensis]